MTYRTITISLNRIPRISIRRIPVAVSNAPSRALPTPTPVDAATYWKHTFHTRTPLNR